MIQQISMIVILFFLLQQYIYIGFIIYIFLNLMFAWKSVIYVFYQLINYLTFYGAITQHFQECKYLRILIQLIPLLVISIQLSVRCELFTQTNYLIHLKLAKPWLLKDD